MLKRFNIVNAKPVNVPLRDNFKLLEAQSPMTEDENALILEVPYASAMGSLMYAISCTRPDIAQAVRVSSRYMSNSEKEHWRAMKWILRYLKGSSDMVLCYGGMNVQLLGYVDSNFAGDLNSRRSTTSYAFTLGNRAVSWVLRLQKVVILLTIEDEYIVGLMCGTNSFTSC